ncbi:hypothetical protein FOMPIDRAFT_159635 [Fomitopsis schrenkii]|uniref:Uncharacterized protein n=1 Tax=Fomitopsis schrenkii TaxID=2126942 RepID=S8FUZ3_FOMSC|nr:hypothetical protein FOMPIDRAFT_159635 [Fomitopsis schrenkii]
MCGHLDSGGGLRDRSMAMCVLDLLSREQSLLPLLVMTLMTASGDPTPCPPHLYVHCVISLPLDAYIRTV